LTITVSFVNLIDSFQHCQFAFMSPELKKQFASLNSDNHLTGQALDLLKIHYGFTSFRPGQEQVIHNVLEGKSTVVIMPTGGGKSLCYQLPALVLEGITIVISPLISLMKDQVDSLARVGIPATFVNSSISPAETSKRLEDVTKGIYKLLYIAPERFYSQEFVRALENIKVSLFAIDEAHCISQWGHDFRPSYMKLKSAIEALGNPAVLALTATATPEVKEDIIKQLGLVAPELVITGFARPNLQFAVIQAADSLKPRLVMDAINASNDGSGIVYVSTRNRADNLLEHLLENNVEAVRYHAGMDAEERKIIQDGFMNGKVKVIVATNAFGLGIDKRDIRFVIHYDMPGTVEAYYQEAGRAGRDGKPSFCLMFYNSRDRHLQEFFIKGDNPPPEMVLAVYENLKDYESDTVLITYSDLLASLPGDFEAPEMAVGTSLKILEREGYITRAKEKTGNAFLKISGDYSSVLEAVGARAKTQRELAGKLFDKYRKELGTGWEINFEDLAGILGAKKDSLMRLVRNLEEKNLAEYHPPFRGTEINILKRVEPSEINIDFSFMKDKSRKAYEKLDQIENYAYHFGCRQAFILKYFGDDISEKCGQCDNCLNGFGYVRKMEAPVKSTKKWKYSQDTIKRHGNISELGENLSAKAGIETKLTQLQTFDLYNKGMDIDGMAQTRNLKPATIVDHLCWLLEKKMKVDIDKFVKPAKQKIIKAAIKELGPGKITPIKEKVGDEANWDEIKLVLASYKK